MRIHHGAVDHEMITAGRPAEVMEHMRDVLLGMGIDAQVEGDFKYRCIRPSRRHNRQDATITSAGTNGVCSFVIQTIHHHSSSILPTPNHIDAVYGNLLEDVGDEVRFSVELTRLDRLKDTYSLDIRRLKGNLKSYKFLYDTLRT
ncbi:hypothetical protein DFH09DRAFT_950980 [Mycena vulgaris]|nr:hypothetical protein DFH09DRAFT_950980 [Mycena vulgaris]